MTVTWPTFPDDSPAIATDHIMGFRSGVDAKFLANSWLLTANNLSDVADATASFDNISPLTTTGDLIYFDGTHNVRLAIGTSAQLLNVTGGIPAWVNNPGLLIANNLSDVNNKTTSFDHISPLTTTGDIIYFNGTHNVRLAIGTSAQILNVTAGIPAWINNPAVLPAQVQDQAPTYAVDSGAANVIVLALSPALGAYADGQYVCFKAAAANTGATTVNVNSLGAKAIVTNANAALSGGEILANGQYIITYNSTFGAYVLH